MNYAAMASAGSERIHAVIAFEHISNSLREGKRINRPISAQSTKWNEKHLLTFSRDVDLTGVNRMIKYVLTATILLGSVTAASAAEYFIVRGPDKKCKVVEKRPTEKTVVVIGERAYVSREEATKQVKVVCKERD